MYKNVFQRVWFHKYYLVLFSHQPYKTGMLIGLTLQVEETRA